MGFLEALISIQTRAETSVTGLAGGLPIGWAFATRMVARWLRSMIAYVHRTSAWFLVGASLYLVYYWVFITGSF